MDEMTLNEYQRAAQRTSSTRYIGIDAQIQNGAMGLAGEAGEVIDVVKKWMFQGHGLDREKLIDEASDCFWYLAELATGLGVTLEQIAQHNVDKLWKRYPAGFDSVRSVHRAEYGGAHD